MRLPRLGLLLLLAPACVFDLAPLEAPGAGRWSEAPPECAYEGPLTVDDSSPLEDGVIVLKDRCFRRDATQLTPGNPDQTEPVIRIATTRPVRIDHCVLVGAGNLVDATAGEAHVTIHRTSGYVLEPTVDGAGRGRFLVADRFVHAEVTRSYLGHTGGLQLWNKLGDGSDGRTVRVVGNVVRELDGRLRGGAQAARVDLVSFNGLRSRGVEIAWNHVVNTPGQSSVGNAIELFRAAGFEDSPLRVHHNFIRGGWPYPLDTRGWSTTGLVTTGDHDAPDESAWVLAEGNVFVSLGFDIALGSHHRYTDNTYLSSGLRPDGQPIDPETRCFWCVASLVDPSSAGCAGTSFVDNRITSLRIGLNQGAFLPVACPERGNAIDGVTLLPAPVTLATEDAAEADFFVRAAAAGVTVGP